MATLHLVITDNNQVYLQGTGDPSRNADFSLFDLDGEGGDPFRLASGSKWLIMKEIPGQEYDPADHDSFWAAQQAILKAAKETNCPNPQDYEAVVFDEETGEDTGATEWVIGGCGKCALCLVRACDYAKIF